MQKLSATKVAEAVAAASVLLKQASAEIKYLREENVRLQGVVNNSNFEKRAQSLARRMEGAGIDSNLSFEDKVNFVAQRAQQIDTLEAAMDFHEKRASSGKVGTLLSEEPSEAINTKTRLLDYLAS